MSDFRSRVATCLLMIVSAVAHGQEHQRGTAWYDQGLHFSSANGEYTADIALRAQIRLSNVNYDRNFGNPNPENHDLDVNRLRFKLGGQLGGSWLKYYTEFDFVRSVLLDLWLAPSVNESLGFRVGQYKVPYNRERFDSSGNQQFAERSIVTPGFTLDRQIGATAMGRVFKGEKFDSNYATGIFLGTGLGGSRDYDGKPLLFGRWQWNIFQKEVPFSRSDLNRQQERLASLAFAASTNRSAYTSFSTAGGGELPGFEPGEQGQYGIQQAMLEFAYMYRGLSIQSEFHVKQVKDRINQTKADMDGFYFETGYFFSELISWVPEPLELMVRYAKVSPGALIEDANATEMAVGANWFINGHRNKLTFDVTRLKTDIEAGFVDSWAVQLQWDVSI